MLLPTPPPPQEARMKHVASALVQHSLLKAIWGHKGLHSKECFHGHITRHTKHLESKRLGNEGVCLTLLTSYAKTKLMNQLTFITQDI